MYGPEGRHLVHKAVAVDKRARKSLLAHAYRVGGLGHMRAALGALQHAEPGAQQAQLLLQPEWGPAGKAAGAKAGARVLRGPGVAAAH